MQRLYPQLIIDALSTVRYPGNGKNIVELEMVADDIRIDGNKVSFSLIFQKPTDPFMRSLVKSAEAAIHTQISPEVEVTVNTIVPQAAAPKPPLLPGVKNIIGVSSGKGGVGKSTVASNLAVALAREGYKVGLLDADIFGPSMPKMFGLEDAELYMHEVDGRQLIIPAERYGVKLLSIGFLVDKNAPVLWRGSMASNALRQLIEEADWGELDYFLIDMPPGTSDIHLTLVQTLALTGVVVVSTPQQVALADARKGIAMFTSDKVNVPVLGLVENMAWFTPEKHPDERYYIFGRPFIALSSVFSGYFTACGRVTKPAVVHFLEQLVCVSLTAVFLFLAPKGDVELSCACVTLAGAISDGISFFMMLGVFLHDVRTHPRTGRKPEHLMSRLMGISLPLAISAYTRSGLSTLQNMLIPTQLRAFGMTAAQALSAYGAIHGMAFTVICFPACILQVVAELLVPKLTELQVQRRTERIRQVCGFLLAKTLLYASAVSVVLFFAADWISAHI